MSFLWIGVALTAAFSFQLEVEVTLVDGAVVIADPEGASGLTLDESFAERVRITVHDEGDDVLDGSRPSIVGRFHAAEGALRFVPMFPFEPGMSYRVSIEGAEPASTVLRLPARDVTPTTVVTHVYPTSDVLPENQLKLYVHFSAPMAGGDGLEHVRLVDEEGRVVVDPFLPLGEHFWDRERRRYTIFFDPGRVKQGILPNEQMGRPILEGKHYRLVIDPAWRDGNGEPLAAGFEKRFAAGPTDETPIDTTTWAIVSPNADTREPLVLTFPEPLDHGILGRAIEVHLRDGTLVAGRITIEDGETRWLFEPDAPWRAGEHDVVVLSDLEDLAGNRIGQPFEVDVFDRIERPGEQQQTYVLPFVVTSAP